jgi:hypothetical protein
MRLISGTGKAKGAPGDFPEWAGRRLRKGTIAYRLQMKPFIWLAIAGSRILYPELTYYLALSLIVLVS